MSEAPATTSLSPELKRIATRGALWVTLTSAAALPLGYYRSWILGRLGSDGTVVGSYAIILLFIQIVVTFVLFGGPSVVTNFLPKIERAGDKSAFVYTYGLISMLFAALFVALVNIFPSFVTFLIRKPVDLSTLRVLSMLVPIVVLSQMAIFCLAGMMEFRLSSLLTQVQLFVVCLFATIAWILFPDYMVSQSIPLLAASAGMANVLVIGVGTWHLARRLPRPGLRRYLPPNFWRFSSFVHLNSISTFAYQSIDQFVILAAVGTAELGAYFVLLQCAQLITFVPQRIGQVMLASFSHLVAGGDRDQLCRAYTRLCRVILIMSTPIAVFLVLFSYPIAAIFGDWSAARHLYLLALAAAIYAGTLGSVNSMLIMAKERTGYFLANSLVLIAVQLLVTLLLLNRWGAYAVIAGKASGIVSGQVGLFSIVRWKLGDVRLAPPGEFWAGLGVVLASAAFAVYRAPLGLPVAGLAFVVACITFMALIRFRVQEVKDIVHQRKNKAGSAS